MATKTIKAPELAEMLVDDVMARYEEREQDVGPERLRQVERRIMLSVVDRVWREHLYEMDHLRDGIGLRAVGQRDPLVEYQKEAYEAFIGMMARIKEEATGYFFNLPVQKVATQPVSGDGEARKEPAADEPRGADPTRLSYTSSTTEGTATSQSAGASYSVATSTGPAGAGAKPGAGGGSAAAAAVAAQKQTQGTVTKQKVGRNEPCPCGSGQKYKKCHGA
jgi:preprotein translocase subunit SecA